MAFDRTYRVCGNGPSAASTSSRTPSTMARARSTSPPKSAWPGVSTRLIFTSRQCTDAALARMVMPRSRSWSFESMTRSTSRSCAANVPVWRRMASTRVVLPWSTCATRATLRSEGVDGFSGGVGFDRDRDVCSLAERCLLQEPREEEGDHEHGGGDEERHVDRLGQRVD